MPSQSVRKNKQPMTGVRCSSSLFTIVMRVKTKYLFISHFSPEVSVTYIKIYLVDQLKLSLLTCTRLKTKFRMYASFHILINEQGLPWVNNMGVWPSGCLTAPFYGQFNPNQIYSPEVSNILVAVVPAPPRDKMNKCVNPKGDDGTNGSSSWCSMWWLSCLLMLIDIAQMWAVAPI